MKRASTTESGATPFLSFNSFEDETDLAFLPVTFVVEVLSIPLRMKHGVLNKFAGLRLLYLSIPLKMKRY